MSDTTLTLPSVTDALNSGDATRALELVDQLVSTQGESADCFLLRAKALLALGRLAEARKSAKACLKLRMGFRDALNLLDEIDEALSKPEQPNTHSNQEAKTAPNAEKHEDIRSVGGQTNTAAGNSQHGAATGSSVFDSALESALGGAYTIEKKLGQGGMGIVYLCRGYGGQTLALKTIPIDAIQDEKLRKSFLRELSTWISLPNHPNLVGCKFFRTLPDRIAIFAEYVEGGALDHWIAERRLSSLRTILDVSIQVAWGLDVAHRSGVVHQDIKPSNILMTKEGIPKITDFGLSRTKPPQTAQQGYTVGDSNEDSGDDQRVALNEAIRAQRIEVTCAGMSIGYCSPEQAAGRKLDAKTDQWSFALCMVDMFVGKGACPFGPEAPQVLLSALASKTPVFLQIPLEVAEILMKCFSNQPHQRYESMGDVADALRDIYEKLVGSTYSRARPELHQQVYSQNVREILGVGWSEPTQWLRRVAFAEGKPPTEYVDRNIGQTPTAQATEDLVLFDQVAERYEKLIIQGNDGHIEETSLLYREKALIHQVTGDWEGALLCNKRAASLLEPLVQIQGRDDLARALGVSYSNGGNCLRAMGDVQQAYEYYGQAEQLWQSLVEHKGRVDLTAGLVSTKHNRAVSAKELGAYDEALRLVNDSISIWQDLANEDQEAVEIQAFLAMALNTKALIFRELGQEPQAVQSLEEALKIHSAIVAKAHDAEKENDLAMVLMNLAMSKRNLGQLDEALQRATEAEQLRARLVEQGRIDLSHDLAISYASVGTIYGDMGNFVNQVAYNNKAVGVWERLVYEQGRDDLAPSLGLAYTNLAESFRELGSISSSLEINDKAVKLWEYLVARHHRTEDENALAMTTINKAIALQQAGDPVATKEHCDKVIERLTARIELGCTGLDGLVAWARVVRAQAKRLLGDEQGAQDDATHALIVLPIEIARTGRADLLSVYQFAVANFAGSFQ